MVTECPTVLDPAHPLHPAVDFVYPNDETEDLRDEDAKRLLKALNRLLRWIWDDGKSTVRGGMRRCAVVTWMLAPEAFGNASQVDLAAMLGLNHKQSLGRDVSDFRRDFGYFNRLMRSEEAILKFKARFQKERDKD